MACYRSGGCGPYEYLSCSECPASKPEYAVEKTEPRKTKSGIQALFSSEYVQGYTAALQDIQRIVSDPGIANDLKVHGKRMTPKTLAGIIDALVKDRAILRENPKAFVRCSSDGGFEIHIEHTDENGKHL